MEDTIIGLQTKQPLFPRGNSDPQVDLPIREGRYFSADSIPFEKKKRFRISKIKKSVRSLSAGENANQFMSPLSFENIDLKNTPLSSLRSCSEYNRVNSGQLISHIVENEVRNSFWSALFHWNATNSPAAKSTKKKQKVRFMTKDAEEQKFLVEKLRFNEANLMEDEDYNYRLAKHQHSKTPTCFSALVPTNNFSSSFFSFSTSSSSKSAVSNSSSDYSIFHESTVAFDYLFGIKVTGTNDLPMEIELKTLKEPEYFTTYHPGETVLNVVQDRVAPIETLGIRRVTSFRTLERIDQSDLQEDQHIIQVLETNEETLIEFDWRNLDSWRSYLFHYYTVIVHTLRSKFDQLDNNQLEHDAFYECIRLQPFSSGAYLRGMLLAGLSSMVFQCYNLVTWPDIHRPVTGFQSGLQWGLYFLLFIQIIINICQFPFRMHIHYQCWEASRAVEVDNAILMIRNMISSDSWFLNKILGHILDGIAIWNLLFTEIYLRCYSVPNSDPIRSLVVSLCATNLLTFVCRVVVATAYSISSHDPQIISEARRRGLSKWDLEVLPTFVFSCPEEVTTNDCAICLCCFDIGEMLISLPCDKKHSFHANCIRQWLQRQNSCPLCQRMV
jgi:hypothetical protein